MNSIMNENVIGKASDSEKPLIQKIDFLIEYSIRDCLSKYFHTIDHICEYDINFTNINKNETVNFTISDKNMGLFELSKKLTVARQRSFIFNQINKLTIKIFSNRSSINIHYYLKHRIPRCHRLFFRKISQNRDYIQTHSNDRRNPY